MNEPTIAHPNGEPRHEDAARLLITGALAREPITTGAAAGALALALDAWRNGYEHVAGYNARQPYRTPVLVAIADDALDVARTALATLAPSRTRAEVEDELAACRAWLDHARQYPHRHACGVDDLALEREAELVAELATLTR